MRQYRKLGSHGLSPRVVHENYTKIVEDETNLMVQHLYDQPNDLLDALRKLVPDFTYGSLG